MISEEKMKIVINNYFKIECSANTSIREAFEKGFRIGVSKVQKKGKWIIEKINTYELPHGTTAYEPVYRCSACQRITESYLRGDEPIMPEDADFPRFCPWCGADMRGEKKDD